MQVPKTVTAFISYRTMTDKSNGPRGHARLIARLLLAAGFDLAQPYNQQNNHVRKGIHYAQTKEATE